MNRLCTIIAVALVALVAVGNAAAADRQPCAGAPAAYVAAFDKLDGAKDGAVRYSQPRYYDEHQTWATPPGQKPSHHSEHIHQGACLPNGVTITDAAPLKRIDVQYTFHNVADYKVVQAARSAVTSGGSTSLYSATPAQIAELQAGMDASSSADHNVTTVAQSYPVVAPTFNATVEIRGGIEVVEDGPTAIFQTWRLDVRNYWTYAMASLPTRDVQPGGFPNQMSIRLRSVVEFTTPDGVHHVDYHHSGWKEHLLNRQDIVRFWPNGKTANLRVSDGGGAAMLMVDPDLHNHYSAPTPACPNIDADGNCLGKWFKDLGDSRTWPHDPCECAYLLKVAIPTGSLSPGWHRLVFMSSDAGKGRGTWTNVSVRMIRVRA